MPARSAGRRIIRTASCRPRFNPPDSGTANGFRLRDRGTPVLDLLPPAELAAGQRPTLDLTRELNLRHRETRPGFTELDARIASCELAYRRQSAALEVGDLEHEPPTVRQQYGLEHRDARTQSFGRKCLLAHRLVERGRCCRSCRMRRKHAIRAPPG